MIPNVKEKKAEVKKIWLQHWKVMKPSDIYKEFLGAYFDVANYGVSQDDWRYYIRWLREWQNEEKKKEIEKQTSELSDEDILLIQNRNRKRMILMLDAILKKYVENPKKLDTVGIEEVRRWYKALQSIEEAIKRTQISKGKLGLDAARTFLLPYNKLTPEELAKLRFQLNESIDRILELKSERLDDGTGQDIIGSG